MVGSVRNPGVLVLVGVLLLLSYGRSPAGELAPLPVEGAVTTAELTEDGLLLVVAHEAANKLSVYDVKAAKVVKTVTCPAPRHVLCRGGKVFVANYGKGTISVIDPAKDWAISDQVLSGASGVYYLSAPGGKFFKGVILACCGERFREGKAYANDVA